MLLPLVPLFPLAAGKAVLLMNLCLLLQVLLGGFLVNPHTIPVWLRWLRYACPLRCMRHLRF